jgi:hypothetical protein
MTLIVPPPKELVFPEGLKPPPQIDYDARDRKRASIITAILRARGEEREQLLAHQYLICSQDILYWLNNFCFVFEPRSLDEQDKPFFTWTFQEVEFLFLYQVLLDCSREAQGKKENVLYEKSRDMTCSWIICMTFLHFFLFRRASFQIGSRKEEEVDKPGDMDTPFQKIKYQLRKHEEMFPWLLPKGWRFDKHTGVMKIIHPSGQGQVVGESANTEFGRGGRNLASWLDEMGSWEYASEAWRACSGSSKVRIATSTPPKSDTHKFARLRNQLDGQVIVRTLHWVLHPEKAKDLQIINGRPTSSWYREEVRTNSAEDVAKEVDISYKSTIKGRVFDKYGFGHQDRDLKPVKNKPIILAWDPGLHFFVLFGQVDSYERVLFFRELYLKEAHLDDVAEAVKDICAREFYGWDFEHCGDPYGMHRQVSMQVESEYAALKRLHDISVLNAFPAGMASKDKVIARNDLLNHKMGKYSHDRPMLLVNPEKCSLLDRAFAEEYRRKVDENGEVIPVIDEKHPYEDAVDCAGMLALYKIPWTSFAKSGGDRVKVRPNNTSWERPNKDNVVGWRRRA